MFSDGQRIALIAKPTDERPETPFRYISDSAAVIPAGEFEEEIDRFVDQVLQRLQSMAITNTNLEQIWNSVQEERKTQNLACRRKLEALLGREPDESDNDTLDRLIADAQKLGMRAVEEIAADHGHGGDILTAGVLGDIARANGSDASRDSVVSLPPLAHLPSLGVLPAWQLGADTAKALRAQEQLGSDPIRDGKLSSLLGVRPEVLKDHPGSSALNISFVLDDGSRQSRVVLRSKWHAGRRFELARLLGDRITNTADRQLFPAESVGVVGNVGGITNTADGQLFPATRAYTYRQKAQRSFAAELLSPFESVAAMLGDDYSMERQSEVAEYFKVSELTIHTLLVNHGRIEREDPDWDLTATE